MFIPFISLFYQKEVITEWTLGLFSWCVLEQTPTCP